MEQDFTLKIKKFKISQLAIRRNLNPVRRQFFVPLDSPLAGRCTIAIVRIIDSWISVVVKLITD